MRKLNKNAGKNKLKAKKQIVLDMLLRRFTTGNEKMREVNSGNKFMQNEA